MESEKVKTIRIYLNFTFPDIISVAVEKFKFIATHEQNDSISTSFFEQFE